MIQSGVLTLVARILTSTSSSPTPGRSSSVSRSTSSGGPLDLHVLLQEVEEALSRAKQQGGDQIWSHKVGEGRNR